MEQEDYLVEYELKFNLKLSTHRAKHVFRLMQQTVSIEPVSRQEIVS